MELLPLNKCNHNRPQGGDYAHPPAGGLTRSLPCVAIMGLTLTAKKGVRWMFGKNGKGPDWQMPILGNRKDLDQRAVVVFVLLLIAGFGIVCCSLAVAALLPTQ